jgi:Major Facilitator Superfamily
MLLVGAAFFAMWYFLSLYLQNVLGDSPLRAGLSFLPMAISIIVGAQLSARALPKVGGRPILFVGTVLAAVGFSWMSRIGAHSSYVDHVLGPGILVSLALGLLFTPLAATATAGVLPHESGLASGVLNTSRQVGGSIGLAALATVATDRTHSVMVATHAAAASAAGLAEGYSRAFEIAALLGAAAFLCAFIVPSIRPRREPEPGRGLQVEPVPQQA